MAAATHPRELTDYPDHFDTKLGTPILSKDETFSSFVVRLEPTGRLEALLLGSCSFMGRGKVEK